MKASLQVLRDCPDTGKRPQGWTLRLHSSPAFIGFTCGILHKLSFLKKKFCCTKTVQKLVVEAQLLQLRNSVEDTQLRILNSCSSTIHSLSEESSSTALARAIPLLPRVPPSPGTHSLPYPVFCLPLLHLFSLFYSSFLPLSFSLSTFLPLLISPTVSSLSLS